ncbi:NlpC/P60 family protein [Agrococcus jejuensis]|uniref:NlpC/P60 family protein n=1 Tax=Agrococcus jejuensis TaxID=399736 RepID=UPI0021B6781D|nr:NlpC/P60 family protein [Agrococcus jejuensis]
MTRSTEIAETVGTTDETPKASRTSRATHLRRIGVAGVAVALVMPLALPAFASTQGETQEPGFAAQAADSQSVTATSTAGSPEQEAERQELYATTPAELASLQAELQAQADAAAAEQAAADEAAAQQEAAANAGTGSSAATSTAVSVGAGGSTIASAALAQIGEIQDCTKLVADSLAAVGIAYTGMGNLFNLGPTIPASQATPGDIIYYSNGGFGSAHVAVYIGNGQAVHGGWNGNQTVVAGATIPGASAPVFIDVG